MVSTAKGAGRFHLVQMKTAQDWDDAADLFEQGAALAEMQDSTYTTAARNYAVKRMSSLAMFATGKAVKVRETQKELKACK